MGIFNLTHANKKARQPQPQPLTPQQIEQNRMLARLREEARLKKEQEEREKMAKKASIKYEDYPLRSTKRRGQDHIMYFKTFKPVNFAEFTRPVKLHRKDAHQSPIVRQPHSDQSAGSSPAAGPSNSKGQSQQQQQQHGPKTGADTSLIAPMGGATRNKQMLFKKRTKQIFIAKDDTRELREKEGKPWILEDYDQQNSYIGNYEGGRQSHYALFALRANDFQYIPVNKWYSFQAKRRLKQLSLEEAEEQLKKQQKKEQDRWMMLKRNKELIEKEEQEKLKQVKSKKSRDPDDEESNRGRKKATLDDDMDELDFDEDFQDDEEGGGEFEFEDEEMKDSKERIKRENRNFGRGAGDENDEVEDEDEDDLFGDKEYKLTSEGKQIRKLVRELEKNGAYESDDEDRDPYAASEDEVESEEEKEPLKEFESAPPEPKKPNPLSNLKRKAMIQKPALPPKKIKPGSKEAMSRPIATPSAHPNVKKRPAEEDAHAAKRHKPESGARDSDLITEEEVIAVLRGKRLTTKEFLLHFRKRIKKNEKNREIVTSLLKKVARHITSDGSDVRLLELNPEYQ